MFRRVGALLLAAIVLVVTTGFVMVQPANVSVTPVPEGPPRPPTHQLTVKAPRVYCEAALLVDNRTNEMLYGKGQYDIRPIASITKLLTVLTWLDFGVDWESQITMTREDAYKSSRSRLRAGDTYRVRDLFMAALIASDNRAARALARSSGLSLDSFVVVMNRKARDLGLLTLTVEEVTGLSEKNVGSAADCARLLNLAASNQEIKRAMRSRTYEFVSTGYKRKYRLTNTNRLLRSRWYIEGGKTGYIFESGWCVAVRARDWHGNDLTAVVLGARSKSSRFSQAAKMFNWAFRGLQGS
jgi:D-alanyl-D-alanine endopeptidase (penicillin-binding protein 7)